MTSEEVLVELASVQAQIDACATDTPRLYARRIELVQEGQELGLTVREMADESGAAYGALRQALHNARAS